MEEGWDGRRPPVSSSGRQAAPDALGVLSRNYGLNGAYNTHNSAEFRRSI
jgi:hypothetical protein